MRNYHELEVKEIRRETADSVTVLFDVPDDLRDIYAYRQGQHVGLRREINGEDVRRSYSICASVADDRLEVAIRKLEEGAFSSYANEELAVGDVLDVFPPAGHFNVDLDKKVSKNYVAFASGSGITPVISIIKTTLESEPKSTFTLFYGNRTGRSTIFKTRLSDIKNRFLDRFSFFHFFSRESLEIDFFNGRLDAAKVAEILNRIMPGDLIDAAFICGPAEMIEAVTQTLENDGVKKSLIHSEHFISPNVARKTRRPARRDTTAAKGQVAVTIIRDGDRSEITLDRGDEPLLDAISDHGIDVPFSCKGGVCCTCRAKVTDGEVDMVLNYGLEPDELEKGYVLTCQSYPVSDRLTLDFDK